jgi:hypothetical protein
LGKHSLKRKPKPRLLPALGFVFVASLVLVSAVDPYSGQIASAQTVQVFEGPEEEFQQLEIIELDNDEDFTRGGFELLTGGDALFINSAPYPVPNTAKAFALEMVNAKGWDYNQYSCLVKLWERESNWRWNAENKSSGAYGIPQSLPGSKMASAGADWRTNPETQIKWGIGYIKGRYGKPCSALAHSDKRGWY